MPKKQYPWDTSVIATELGLDNIRRDAEKRGNLWDALIMSEDFPGNEGMSKAIGSAALKTLQNQTVAYPTPEDASKIWAKQLGIPEQLLKFDELRPNAKASAVHLSDPEEYGPARTNTIETDSSKDSDIRAADIRHELLHAYDSIFGKTRKGYHYSASSEPMTENPQERERKWGQNWEYDTQEFAKDLNKLFPHPETKVKVKLYPGKK